jgi:hypothetical protein
LDIDCDIRLLWWFDPKASPYISQTVAGTDRFARTYVFSCSRNRLQAEAIPRQRLGPRNQAQTNEPRPLLDFGQLAKLEGQLPLSSVDANECILDLDLIIYLELLGVLAPQRDIDDA